MITALPILGPTTQTCFRFSSICLWKCSSDHHWTVWFHGAATGVELTPYRHHSEDLGSNEWDWIWLNDWLLCWVETQSVLPGLAGWAIRFLGGKVLSCLDGLVWLTTTRAFCPEFSATMALLAWDLGVSVNHEEHSVSTEAMPSRLVTRAEKSLQNEGKGTKSTRSQQQCTSEGTRPLHFAHLCILIRFSRRAF